MPFGLNVANQMLLISSLYMPYSAVVLSNTFATVPWRPGGSAGRLCLVNGQSLDEGIPDPVYLCFILFTRYKEQSLLSKLCLTSLHTYNISIYLCRHSSIARAGAGGNAGADLGGCQGEGAPPQPYSPAVGSSTSAGPCARPPSALQPSSEQQHQRRPLRSPPHSPTAQQ
jgi:hypothetical protein